MFRIGEKVRIIKNCGGYRFDKYVGSIATIISVYNDCKYYLDIPSDDSRNGYSLWTPNDEFVKLERKEKLERILSFCHDKSSEK